MMLIKTISAVLITYSLSATAGPSGCIVTVKKKNKLDPTCSCLKTGTCYTGKEIKNSSKFFDPIDGKAWIGTEEKKLLTESHEVYNQLLSLRSKGLIKSREAREQYQKLNEINQQLKVVQKKDNEKNRKKINSRNKRLGLSKPKENSGFFAKLKKFINTPFEKLTLKSQNRNRPKSAKTAKALTTTPPKEKEVAKAQTFKPFFTAPKDKKEGLSKYAKEGILLSLKQDKQSYPQDFVTKDEDSLFTRVSKAYLRSAYEVLLSPEESQR